MSAATVFVPHSKTLAELLEQLGDIPPERILVSPPPGIATEKHLIALCESIDKCLVELIDGVLVAKPLGATESYLTAQVGHSIGNYLDGYDLGLITGPDGPFCILPEQIRLPDVSVVFWDSLPSRMVPSEKIPRLVPDLAVHVYREGNTSKEMERRLRDYFRAGVKEMWIIYPKNRNARIYASPENYKRISISQSLTSEAILPGFELPMATLFERVPTEKSKNNKK